MRQKGKPKLTAPGIWLSGPISTRTFSTSAGVSHTAKRKVVLTCARRTPSREGYAPPKMKSDQLVPNGDVRLGIFSAQRCREKACERCPQTSHKFKYRRRNFLCALHV